MDDLYEFERLRDDLDELIWYGCNTREQKSAYMHSREMLYRAIEKWRKRHQQENSCLSVEVFDGELCPLLDKQVGFGEEE